MLVKAALDFLQLEWERFGEVTVSRRGLLRLVFRFKALQIEDAFLQQVSRTVVHLLSLRYHCTLKA